MSIVVRRSEGIDATKAAAASRVVLARGLADEAELWIAPIVDEALVLGAYGRAAGLPARDAVVRRGSGGPAVRVARGTMHVVLALASPSSLVTCDAPRLVNRYVRPLLKALGRSGAMAHYFDRDWISVKHRPAAWVGFAHDATTGRCALEAFVALRARFDVEARASYLGKEPGMVEEIAGVAIDEGRFADAIVQAYAGAYGRAAIEGGAYPEAPVDAPDPRRDPPWAATTEEAIGVIGAGPDADGRLRVGGDWLVSADAHARLEERLAGAPVDDVASIIDATLGAPGVALVGVRSLASVHDVVTRARRA